MSLREALVNEANHRIKNSLAIALAMLRVEKQEIARSGEGSAQSAMSALVSLEARINAISGVHGMMELAGDKTDVSLHVLLDRLVSQTRSSVGLGETDLRLIIDGADRRLHSDMATTLAMILNELLTNTLKYGLSKDGSADIEVAAQSSADGTVIAVENRIESAQPIEAISSTRVGSMLIQQLANDFGAHIDTDTKGDIYAVHITLPETTRA
nr:sensor histidine kinase [Marivita sp. GX14005]